jgi:hypothetical protein
VESLNLHVFRLSGGPLPAGASRAQRWIASLENGGPPL